MKVCKKIELVFENCEVIDITTGVGHFEIQKLSEEIRRLASNCIANMKTADYIAFSLFEDGIYKGNLWKKDKECLNRIEQHNDITSISITYSDDTQEGISVDYKDIYEDEILISANKNQTSKRDDKNNLYVVICKDKTVDEIFTDDVIEELNKKKDYIQPYEVSARRKLEEKGWKITWESDTNIQLFKYPVVINLCEGTCSIYNLKDFENKVLIRDVELYDLENICLESLYYKTEYTKLPFNTDWLRGDDIKTLDRDDGEKNIIIKYISGDNTYTLDYTISEHSDKNYSGKVIFNDIEIDGNDLIEIMWVHKNVLTDKFWEKLK